MMLLFQSRTSQHTKYGVKYENHQNYLKNFFIFDKRENVSNKSKYF